jgi:hypothetical protein
MSASVNPYDDPAIRAAVRWGEFHVDNPHVYATLVLLARRWVSRTGQAKLGVQTLLEGCRWHVAITTKNADFKINNNYGPFYARLIMARESDLAGLFEVRRSVAEVVDWESYTEEPELDLDPPEIVWALPDQAAWTVEEGSE